MTITTGAWLITFGLFIANIAGWISISYWLVFLPIILTTGLALLVFFFCLAVVVSAGK